MPMYNDWNAAMIVLERLSAVFAERSEEVEVLLVDDASTDDPPLQVNRPNLQHLGTIRVLQLRRNLGHQRAIALGICYAVEHIECDAMLIMDSDGEDPPESIPDFITAWDETGHQKVIFSKRGKRHEGPLFRLGYFVYRFLFRLLTGNWISVGNFSLVPEAKMNNLVGVSELWNHYAASVMKARIPYRSIPIDRGKRVEGNPQMNLTALITHGLSSISVFADTVGLRLLLVTVTFSFLTFLSVVAVFVIRFFTELAIPGWATSAMGLLMIVLLLTFVIILIFVFTILRSRSMSTFLPIRDYHYFIGGEHQLQ